MHAFLCLLKPCSFLKAQHQYDFLSEASATFSLRLIQSCFPWQFLIMLHYSKLCQASAKAEGPKLRAALKIAVHSFSTQHTRGEGERNYWAAIKSCRSIRNKTSPHFQRANVPLFIFFTLHILQPFLKSWSHLITSAHINHCFFDVLYQDHTVFLFIPPSLHPSSIYWVSTMCQAMW